MLLNFLLFILGFILVIKGADWLIDGSVSLARKLNISELAIGLTIVAFGTSTPELVVNVVASINQFNDVVMGNIIGSNIFNILAILGISAMIYPITIQPATIKKEIPYSIFAIILLFVFMNDHMLTGSEDQGLHRIEGMILIACLIIFLFHVFKNMKSEPAALDLKLKEYSYLMTIILLIIGLSGLIAGGKIVVNNAIEIAKYFGISERVISLTIISAGTSLPELATSAVAAYRKRSDLAIGNVIGSNIFNIFFILGISSVISPVKNVENFNKDLLILFIATLFLLIAMFTGKKRIIDRWEGLIFLLMFSSYILWLIY